MNKPDQLYAKSRQVVDAFQFDEQVAGVFSDMIQRSVPGYTMMLDMLGVVAESYVKPNTHCYDLGCSLGASTLAIRQNIQAEGCTLVGIDNSEAMVDKCKSVIQNDPSSTNTQVFCQDITLTEFQPSSLICMNLTLQFVPPEEREGLLKKMADATMTDGVLFLSEKIQFTDDFTQSHLTDLHHQFKKHQGYSDLEIAQKRTAIENVLIPETLTAHKERLLRAGYREVIVALQCFNFCTLIAYK